MVSGPPKTMAHLVSPNLTVRKPAHASNYCIRKREDNHVVTGVVAPGHDTEIRELPVLPRGYIAQSVHVFGHRVNDALTLVDDRGAVGATPSQKETDGSSEGPYDPLESLRTVHRAHA